MTPITLAFVAVAFIAGIALGAIKWRKFQALYNDAQSGFEQASNALLQAKSRDITKDEKIASLQKVIDHKSKAIAELVDDADLGRRTREAQAKQNEKRKAARAAAPKPKSRFKKPVPKTAAK